MLKQYHIVVLFCVFSSLNLQADESCLDESSVYSGLAGISNPSTQDIMRLGQLGGNLCPTKPQPQADISSRSANSTVYDDTVEQNQQFGEAMELWNKHHYKQAYNKLDAYTRSHPNGLWTAEAKLHMGCDARFNGRYRESDKHFSEIIKTYSNNQDFGSKRIVNKARSRLAVQRILENNPQGAKQEFAKLLESTKDWRLKTYAQHWLQRINKMEHQAQGLADCGYKALEQVLLKQGKTLKLPKNKAITKETKGQTLAELQSLAKQHGLKLQPLKASIKDLALFPTPFIVQIDRSYSGGAGHYWLVEKVKNKQVQIYDAQSARRFTQSTQEFAKEWQGYALVFDTQNTWQNLALTQQQAEEVMGGCCGIQRPEIGLGRPTGNLGGVFSNGALAEEGGLDECSGSGKGCPTWSVNPKNMNIYITDTPLWYQPAYGPEVKIKLSYNSQSALARNEIFAGKWSFNYGSYIVEDPGGSATVFMPDGGRISFPSDGKGGFSQAYNVVAKLVKKSAMHYELTLKNNQIYVYSQPQGTNSQQVFLTKLKDAQGHSLSFHYNSKVQLISIEDAQGRHTRLTYNQDGFVTQATDPFGRSAYFDYSQDAKSSRKLTSITDMGGFKSELSYDENLYPKTIKKPYGVWTFRVDNPDAYYSVTITDPKGHTQMYSYRLNSNISWYVSPKNYIDNGSKIYVTHEWHYNSRGEAAKTAFFKKSSNLYGQQFSYNSQGRMTSRIDELGVKTSYVYNQFGQKIQIKKNNKLVQSFTYLSPDKDVISSIKDYVGENQTRLTEFTYDSYNNLTKKSISVIEKPESGKREWTYQYNANHQLIKVDGPREDVADISTLSYYSCTGSSNLADCGQLHTSTNALGHVTTYANYHASGKPQQITDPNGLITRYYYDLLGRVIRSEQTDGNSKRTIGYQYAGVMNRVSQVNLPNGEQLNYEYNSDKQLIKLTNNHGDVLELVRDKNGNITQRNLKDSNGQLVKTAKFVYNLYDQIYQKIDSKENITTFWHYKNGKISGISVPNVPKSGTTEGYGVNLDKQGHPKILHPNSSRNQAIKLDHNHVGILNSIIDQKDLKTSYKYNGFGERIERISPDTGTTTYGYDKAGNQIRIQNALGVTTQLKYDALNRLIQVIRTPNPEDKDNQKTEQTDYSWDSNKKGYLNQIHFATGSTTYQYNGFGELIQQTQTTNGKTYTTQYHYNDKGELIGQDYPSANGIQGAKVRYTYQTGRISKIDLLHQGNTLSLASNIEYFPFSGIKSYQQGNGIQYQQQRDQDGLITAYQYTGRQHSDWAKYSYNARSQIEQIQTSDTINRFQYTYNRLVSYDTGYQKAFYYFLRHGRWGDLEDRKQESIYNKKDPQKTYSNSDVFFRHFGYEPNSHALISYTYSYYGGGSLTRDKMGNLLKYKNEVNYSYNLANQLNHVDRVLYLSQRNDHEIRYSADYTYHPYGYRIEKSGALLFDVKRTQKQILQLTSQYKKTEYNLNQKKVEHQKKQTEYYAKKKDQSNVKYYITNTQEELKTNIKRQPEIRQKLRQLREKQARLNDKINQIEQHKLMAKKSATQAIQNKAQWEKQKVAANKAYNDAKGWDKVTTWFKLQSINIKKISIIWNVKRSNRKLSRVNKDLSRVLDKRSAVITDIKTEEEELARQAYLEKRLSEFQQELNKIHLELTKIQAAIKQAKLIVEQTQKELKRVGKELADSRKNKQPKTIHSLYGGNRSHNQYWPISQITYEGNKTHSQQYIYLHGRPIALLQTKATGQSDIYYYQNNHLNAPLKLTDKNQNSVWQAEQKGFEFVVNKQDVVQPLRFVGQVEDTETGFYYNYHRYYNPKIGRYTQPDPIGLAGGFNPYVYASNNPIMKVDPSGLLEINPGDHLAFPPEHNCAFALDCAKKFRDKYLNENPIIKPIDYLINEEVWQIKCGHMNSCACKGGAAMGLVCEFPDGWPEPKKEESCDE